MAQLYFAWRCTEKHQRFIINKFERPGNLKPGLNNLRRWLEFQYLSPSLFKLHIPQKIRFHLRQRNSKMKRYRDRSYPSARISNSLTSNPGGTSPIRYVNLYEEIGTLSNHIRYKNTVNDLIDLNASGMAEKSKLLRKNSYFGICGAIR